MTDCACLDLPVAWNRAQKDYLTGSVTVNQTIDAQTVEISFDEENWITAEWLGTADTTRSWQAYVTPADLPDHSSATVTVRITDNTGPDPIEAYLNAGTITFT